MGLLENNEEGYKNSALVTHAGNLEGELMIVHSLMDDNVHPQNTFQLVKALIDQGKDAELKIFPPGNHGVAYDFKSYIQLQSIYLNFFEKHLKQD